MAVYGTAVVYGTGFVYGIAGGVNGRILILANVGAQISSVV